MCLRVRPCVHNRPLMLQTQIPALTLTCNSFNVPQTSAPPDPLELQRPDEPADEHLLYVKKTSVGRTHSLPNDSYMFQPLQPNSTHSTHTTSTHLAQTGALQYVSEFVLNMVVNACVNNIKCLLTGSTGSVQSQTEEPTQHLTVPTDLFRPISPHSLSDSESIPRIPPPRRAHTLSRTLRRQVTSGLLLLIVSYLEYVLFAISFVYCT